MLYRLRWCHVVEDMAKILQTLRKTARLHEGYITKLIYANLCKFLFLKLDYMRLLFWFVYTQDFFFSFFFKHRIIFRQALERYALIMWFTYLDETTKMSHWAELQGLRKGLVS